MHEMLLGTMLQVGYNTHSVDPGAVNVPVTGIERCLHSCTNLTRGCLPDTCTFTAHES